MEYGNLAEWFRSRQPWLGNVAQLAGAFLTACAIFFALFKEEFRGWIWPPKLVPVLKAEYPYCVKTPERYGSPATWRGFRY
jgi:hypothetical protein